MKIHLNNFASLDSLTSIAHIVNPFKASSDSDLSWAQPVTFESMRLAKTNVLDNQSIELIAITLEGEEAHVPDGFIQADPLTRTIQSDSNGQYALPLPYIADIVSKGLEVSSADYLIYTNVDIAVMPDFYNSIYEIIGKGHDAFVINRRRIPDTYKSVSDLPKMYQMKGKSHPGFDCFVVKRQLLGQFELAKIVIGVPFIGIMMAQNVFCLAQNPKVFEDEHLTFHIGMEIFKKRAPREYFYYNRQEFRKAIQKLMPQLDSRKWPYGDRMFFERMIRWGLNPSLPIKLALALEPRRWK